MHNVNAVLSQTIFKVITTILESFQPYLYTFKLLD